MILFLISEINRVVIAALDVVVRVFNLVAKLHHLCLKWLVVLVNWRSCTCGCIWYLNFDCRRWLSNIHNLDNVNALDCRRWLFTWRFWIFFLVSKRFDIWKISNSLWAAVRGVVVRNFTKFSGGTEERSGLGMFLLTYRFHNRLDLVVI